MGKPDVKTLRYQFKTLKRILSELRSSWVFVEGQKDKAALQNLGCKKIKTISGNLRKSCDELDDVEKVIVLTDLDRRGEQLLLAARDELESCSIRADTDTRRRLAGILALRYFENADRKYEEFMKSVKEMKIER